MTGTRAGVLLSIVIPVFARPRQLDRLLTSIARQSIDSTRIQVVVVENKRCWNRFGSRIKNGHFTSLTVLCRAETKLRAATLACDCPQRTGYCFLTLTLSLRNMRSVISSRMQPGTTIRSPWQTSSIHLHLA